MMYKLGDILTKAGLVQSQPRKKRTRRQRGFLAQIFWAAKIVDAEPTVEEKDGVVVREFKGEKAREIIFLVMKNEGGRAVTRTAVISWDYDDGFITITEVGE